MRRWDTSVDTYIRECATRGLAPSTLTSLRSELEKWGLYLKRKRPRPCLEEIPLEYHVAYIRKRSAFHSKSTTYSVLSRMRCMGDFLVREGLWKRNTLKWIRGPRIDPRGRAPKRIGRRSLEKLLESASCCREEYQRTMMAAIIVLLYSTGMRRGELERLDLSHYDPLSQTISVDGRKTGRPRTIPLPALSVHCLDTYLPLRHNKLEERGRMEETALFINRHGRRKKGSQIGKSVHRLARSAGIPLVTLHQFRHTCASDLLAEGERLSSIQRILGHACVSSTMRYMHISSPERKAAMQSHPINHMLRETRTDTVIVGANT